MDDEEEDEEEESDDEDDEEEDDEDDDDDDGEEESDWQQQLDEALKSNNVRSHERAERPQPRERHLSAWHPAQLTRRLRRRTFVCTGGAGAAAAAAAAGAGAHPAGAAHWRPHQAAEVRRSAALLLPVPAARHRQPVRTPGARACTLSGGAHVGPFTQAPASCARAPTSGAGAKAVRWASAAQARAAGGAGRRGRHRERHAGHRGGRPEAGLAHAGGGTKRGSLRRAAQAAAVP